MKVLLCCIAAWILGTIAVWAMAGRMWFEEYAGLDPDFYKAGGSE